MADDKDNKASDESVKVEGQQLKVLKDTNKKVTFIGNVLNKNIVPASQQAERDAEDGMFKKKLMSSLLSIKDSLIGLAARTVAVAGFPIALIFGAIAFIIAFFTEIGRQLAKLKTVLIGIKNLPQTISGIFASIRGGLVAAREAVALKIANGLKVFREHKSVKLIASGLDDLADAFRMAREGVVLRIKNALAAFKEHKAVKAIGGAFTRMRMLLNAARVSVVNSLQTALAAFKETKIGAKIAGVFASVRNAFTGPKGILTTIRAALPGAKAAGPPGIGQVMKGLVPGTGVQKPVGVATKMADAAKSLRSAIFGPIGKLGGIVGGQITAFKTAALNFKPVAMFGGAFDEVGRIFGRVIGIAGGGPPGAATGGIMGSLRASMAAFRESAVFKAFAGIGKILAGAFGGVLSLIGGAAKVATGPGGAGGKVATGIVGTISKVTGAMSSMVKTIGAFSGLNKIVGFAKTLGTTLGKLLWPVTIIIGVFDFIKGFRKDEGWDGEPASFFTKIGMGISEALQGLIGLPLDMIKGGIAWILKKFGIGTTTDPETGEEMESQWMTTMKEFSFSDLIDKLIGSIWSGIGAVFTWFKELFTDPVGAIVKLATGFAGLLTGIGTWLYNTAIKPIFDWVSGIFSWGETDETTAGGDDKGFSLSGMLFKALDGIKTWLGNMFKFDSAGDLFATAFNVLTFLPNIVLKGLQLISKWLLGLFGFDDAAKKVANADNWTIGGMVATAIKSIFEWFTELFDIDWSALMDKLVPDWAKKILPGFGGDSKEDKRKAAQEVADVAQGKLTSTQEKISSLQGQLGSDKSAVMRSQTNAPDDMNSYKGEKGVWTLVGGDWIFYSDRKESDVDTSGITTKAAERIKEIKAEIKNEQEELAAGDVKGGMIGFQYKREDRIKELQGEITSVETQAVSDVVAATVAADAEKIRIQEEIKALQVRELEEQKVVANAILAVENAAITKQNSLAVHDRHVERAIYGLMQGAAAQTQLLAAYGNGGGSGGGTTVNTVTVAPSTSNTVSSVSKSENVYGTVDPYTSAAGAYG